AVTGVPRGSRPACGGAGVGTTCGNTCNGVAREGCVYPSSVTPCSTTACASGVESHASVCDGVGHCNDVPKVCGAFACGTTTCKATCAANTDCAAGFVCKGTACVPAPGLGEPCGPSAPCNGGLSCTDGVCCGVAACDAGSSCGLPAHRGV